MKRYPITQEQYDYCWDNKGIKKELLAGILHLSEVSIRRILRNNLVESSTVKKRSSAPQEKAPVFEVQFNETQNQRIERQLREEFLKWKESKDGQIRKIFGESSAQAKKENARFEYLFAKNIEYNDKLDTLRQGVEKLIKVSNKANGKIDSFEAHTGAQIRNIVEEGADMRRNILELKKELFCDRDMQMQNMNDMWGDVVGIKNRMERRASMVPLAILWAIVFAGAIYLLFRHGML